MSKDSALSCDACVCIFCEFVFLATRRKSEPVDLCLKISDTKSLRELLGFIPMNAEPLRNRLNTEVFLRHDEPDPNRKQYPLRRRLAKEPQGSKLMSEVKLWLVHTTLLILEVAEEMQPKLVLACSELSWITVSDTLWWNSETSYLHNQKSMKF